MVPGEGIFPKFSKTEPASKTPPKPLKILSGNTDMSRKNEKVRDSMKPSRSPRDEHEI